MAQDGITRACWHNKPILFWTRWCDIVGETQANSFANNFAQYFIMCYENSPLLARVSPPLYRATRSFLTDKEPVLRVSSVSKRKATKKGERENDVPRTEDGNFVTAIWNVISARSERCYWELTRETYFILDYRDIINSLKINLFVLINMS